MDDGPVFPSVPGQRGLATYRQVRDAGFTPAQIRHARGKLWQSPLPQVLAPHRGPLDKQTLIIAASLWAGPRAALTGHLALQEHGLHARDPDVLATATEAPMRVAEGSTNVEHDRRYPDLASEWRP